MTEWQTERTITLPRQQLAQRVPTFHSVSRYHLVSWITSWGCRATATLRRRRWTNGSLVPMFLMYVGASKWQEASSVSTLTGVAPKRSTFVCAVTLLPSCCCCCCCCCCWLRSANDGFGISGMKSFLSGFFRGVALISPVASCANGSGAVVAAGGNAAATNGLPGDGDAPPPPRPGIRRASVDRRTLPFGGDSGVASPAVELTTNDSTPGTCRIVHTIVKQVPSWCLWLI